jgi:UDP:flavonoid glycosyltransferase YjiC (YdhE family)
VKNQNPVPIRILVAPLDWGLGHATRCIPLIRFFLENGCDVWIAAEDKAQQLLQQEFPDLTYIALKGYRIRYGGSKTGLIFNILQQIPGILQTIRYERRWLNKMVSLYTFDAVVSDNRFGLFHPSIPCVYMTHQLRIQVPGGAWVEGLLQRLHYRFIDRFTTCWVPDTALPPFLSGNLGHPIRLPLVPIHYLGILSRFEPTTELITHRLLVLISGPEPQRTRFEQQILRELDTFEGNVMMVRGLPGEQAVLPDGNRLTIVNHLPAAELSRVIAQSEWVIGRAGYSTVMDLIKLKKKGILIPTPGQTEQEYLGRYLRKEGLCYSVPQDGLSLKKALAEATDFPYRFPFSGAMDSYKQVAGEWLQSLKDQHTTIPSRHNG